MVIPDSIRVGSVIYNVEYESPILNMGSQCYGDCDSNTHIIRLDKYLQDEQTLEITFLHELVHAMLFERQINLTKDYSLSYDQCEKLVDSFAYMLHQIICDNSEFLISKQVTKDILSEYGVEINDNGNVVARDGVPVSTEE